MGDLPSVAIIIPTLNEQRHIGAVLKACAEQDYPPDLIEVIVVDGGSTDETVARVKSYVGISQLTYLYNPARHQSVGINSAVGMSQAEVLVRWDAHSRYPRNYVATVVEALAEPDVDMVGGLWVPVGDSVIGDWVAAAMQSRLGVGTDRYDGSRRRRIVDTVHCGAMLRSTFEAVGGFDTTMQPAGEDADLSYRLRRGGGRIILDPAIRVEYVTRPSFVSLGKQFFGYGIAKALMFKKHRRFPSARPLAPAGLVAAMVLGVIYRRPRRTVVSLLGVYLTTVTALAAKSVPGSVARKIGASVAAVVMHVSYGCGVWVGLIRTPAGRRDPRRTPMRGDRLQ